MRARRGTAGHWLWRDREGSVEVAFVGRGPGDRQGAAAAAAAPAEIAWGRQIHSAHVLEAMAGYAGEGDALVGRRAGLALSVVTADCVPVLLGGGPGVAAVHAGWRGIAAGVVGAAVRQLGPPAGEVTAWVGPAIGACCYEVGEEVAARVAAAADETVVASGQGPRPHLDLRAAVAIQLRRSGVHEIREVDHCTRCDPEKLWSYRRDGPGAGRNVALVWLRA